MRRLWALYLRLSVICVLIMTVIDAWLGPRAEFLNAWSVIERLRGRVPTAGDSFVAANYGAGTELVAVVLAAAVVAALIMAILKALGLVGRAR